MRTAIIGPPRAGKTTLALELHRTSGIPLLHADDLIGVGWSAASERLALVLHTEASMIVEGVAVVRALRKYLRERSCKPVDRCIVLERPMLQLSLRQSAMARGCFTVLREIDAELRRRGVTMELYRDGAHYALAQELRV